MFTIRNLSLWTVCSLITASEAYWLDPVSCKNPPIDVTKVQAAIDEAFSMAGNAYLAMDDVIKNNEHKVANVEDLAGWLFGANGGGAGGKWDQAKAHLEVGIQNVHQKSNTKDQIRIYCDLSRLTTKKVDGQQRTTDSDNNFSMRGNSIAACDQSGGTKGWTIGPDASYSTIQLCPWYLQFNGAAKYTGWSGFKMKVGNAIDKGTDFIEGLAQIDGVALLAHTILHEITHTFAAGHTEDIAGPTNSYMWKNCLKLSEQADSKDNAESVAYFGLGVQLINDGYALTKDGKFKKPSATSRSLHELMPEIWVG